MSTSSTTPLEDAMRSKITSALKPSALSIHNDSRMHAHHAAMANSISAETHFRVAITSEAFEAKSQLARHRMVYAVLKEEMELEGGIHALELQTTTAEEKERQVAREKPEEGELVKEIG